MIINIQEGNTRKLITSGYGQMAVGISNVLERLGHKVIWYGDKTKPDVYLWMRPPYESVVPVPRAKNILFTMHELDYLPSGKKVWVERINKFDAIFTPTNWNKKMWEKEGVKVPIYVVPLGVNPEVFHGAKTYNFSILAVHEALGRNSSRENWRETILAYVKTFANAKDTILIIKSWNIKPGVIEDWVHQLGKAYDIHKNLIPEIAVIDKKLSLEQMNGLYSSAWLFVKNANREGWCLPANEALACGIALAVSKIPATAYIWDKVKGVDVFKPGDSVELQEIFKKHYKLYQKVKEVRYQWTWEVTTGWVIKYIREVLAA